jgi:hypothetical protein
MACQLSVIASGWVIQQLQAQAVLMVIVIALSDRIAREKNPHE